MRPLLKEEADIYQKIRTMDFDDIDDREDRANILRFYHGDAPMTESQMRELGRKYNVNWLSGHQVMADSVEQLQSPHTKPLSTFNFQIKKVDQSVKKRYEHMITRKFNEIIKESDKYMPEAMSVASDAAFFGTGLASWDDTKNPFFTALDPNEHLVPRGAPQNIQNVPYDAYKTTITINDLMRFRKIAAKNKSSKWDKKNIDKLLQVVFDQAEYASGTGWSSEDDVFSKAKLEAANSWADRNSEVEIPVFYFHQVRYDLKGEPVELRIFLDDAMYHNTGSSRASNPGSSVNTGEDSLPIQIYHNEKAYENHHQRIVPIHLATNLNGNPLWHQILGLGHLNYNLDTQVEIIINSLVENHCESSRNLWQAGPNTKIDELERLMMKHNSIIPEGLQLVQQKIQPTADNGFSLINFFSQMRAMNGRGNFSNQGDSNTDVLEVQFQAQQIAASERMSNRIAKHNRMWANVGKEMMRRFLNTGIMPEDEGYDEVKEFQSYLKENNIPIKELRNNFTCTLYRLPGDGNVTKQQSIYAHYSRNISMYPPETRQEILREMHVIATGDYEQAERLIPPSGAGDQSQLNEALTENAILRSTGVNPPILPSHVDEVHIPAHLSDMAAMINEIATSGKLETATDNSFVVAGGHVQQHIQRMEMMNRGAEAKPFLQSLQELAAQWDRLQKEVPNVDQERQQRGQSIEERKLAIQEQKLQVDIAKVETQQGSQLDGNLKYARSQDHREKMAEETLDIQRRQIELAEKREGQESDRNSRQQLGEGQSGLDESP